MKRRYSQPQIRGSFTLQVALTTLGTALLAGLFANTVSYITANNAVEQAARVVSRCLTPTDAGCISYSAPLFSTEADWWGVEPSSIVETKTEYVRRYNYSAQMFRQTWDGEFDTYEILKGRPVVNIPLSNIYLHTVRGRLNQFERQYVRIARQVTEVAIRSALLPRYGAANFPGFHEGAELSYRDRSIAAWADNNSSVTPTKDGIPFTEATLLRATQTVPSGDLRTFSTDWINVPLLETGLHCADDSCDDVYAAAIRTRDINGDPITQPSADTWREYAWIAVKAFSEASAISSGSLAELKWGFDPPDPRHTGLELQYAENADGTGPTRTVRLGGRDWSPVDGSSYFNLVLRGPKGANGAAGEPDEESDFHDDIRLRRGGSFRLIATFSARSGAVRVTPRLYYYLNEYEVSPQRAESIIQMSCPQQAQRFPSDPVDAEVPCPSREQCDYPQKAGTSEISFSYDKERCIKTDTVVHREPSCTALDSYPIDNTASLFTDASTYLSCSPDTIDTSAVIAPPAGRQVCDIVSDPSSRVELLQIGSSSTCGTSSIKPFSCQTPITLRTDRTPTFEQCGGLEDELRGFRRRIANLQSVAGAESIALTPVSSSSLSWGEPIEKEWIASWLPLDDDNSDLSANAAARKVNHQVLLSAYLRKNGAEPSIDELTPQSPPGLGAPPVGFWEANLRRTGDPRLDTVRINSVSPFSSTPAVEIPFWGQHGADAFADYDGDCTIDSSCGGAYRRFANLEEALRYYASIEISQATDLRYVFEFGEPEYVDTVSRESISGSIPECTPVQTICEKKTKTGEEKYLGRFSTISHPTGPAECHGPESLYQTCVSTNVELGGVSSHDVTITPDTGRAMLLGYSELNRLLPAAQFGCTASDRPGCADVQIDSPNGAEQPDVTVTYNWPLLPPLNSLLGKESIPITFAKRESYELK